MLSKKQQTTLKSSNIPFKFVLNDIEGDVIDNVVYRDGEEISVFNLPPTFRYLVEKARECAIGSQRSFRVYDNHRFKDRYTLLLMDREAPKGSNKYCGLGIEPNGEYTHVRCEKSVHLGRRVWLSDLPDKVQDSILRFLEV